MIKAKNVDYDLLLKTVKFPIVPDAGGYSSYIWDSDGNMLAQFDDDITVHEYESALGDIKYFNESSGNYDLEDGDFFQTITSCYIASVRGWGRLQYMDNGEQMQDNLANYLLNCLNNLYYE